MAICLPNCIGITERLLFVENDTIVCHRMKLCPRRYHTTSSERCAIMPLPELPHGVPSLLSRRLTPHARLAILSPFRGGTAFHSIELMGQHTWRGERYATWRNTGQGKNRSDCSSYCLRPDCLRQQRITRHHRCGERDWFTQVNHPSACDSPGQRGFAGAGRGQP